MEGRRTFLKRSAILGATLLSSSALAADAKRKDEKAVPIILDTDIGTDVDDAFALALVLAASPVEEGYEHPADSALAAYLWLLNDKNGDYSTRAAEKILACKQSWWARKMAEYIQGQKPRSTAEAASSRVES